MRAISSSKKIFLLLIILLSGLIVLGLSLPNLGRAAQGSEYWYYYQDEKVPLLVIDGEIAVGFVDGVRSLDKSNAITALNSLTASIEITELPTPEVSLLKLDKGLNKRDMVAALDDLRKDPSVSYVYPVFGTPDSRIVLTDQFIARFRSEISEESIKSLNDRNHVEIFKKMLLPDTYLLRAGNGVDTLTIANLYHESDLTLYAEPDFVRFLNMFDIPDDTNYPQQWALNNTGSNIPFFSSTVYPPVTGTAGADIDAEAAWDIEKGDPNIVIGIIDMGVELDHPDLDDKIIAQHTVIVTDTNGTAEPDDPGDGHGTACAGIAAAESDNNLGIAGVCQGCSLMAVQAALGSQVTHAWAADALTWAADNGADIVSISWGVPPSEASTTVNNAITHAVTNGRGGLGTVILVSSGNYYSGGDSSVMWPASNPNTIAVGASSPCDERKSFTSCDGDNWASSYGSTLDVVAPGVRIYTTDMTGSAGYYPYGDYLPFFQGTSSAAPAAAGVAGLILSHRPCLTQTQVRYILEQSAEDQVGPSGEDTAGWDQYMGWGRVNAYDALVMAGNYSCVYVPLILNNSP